MSTPWTAADVDHDGYRTQFLEAGSSGAPVVVLVHDGWFGADAATLWGPLIPALARDHRVLAPDMLGFGRTDKVVYFDRSMYVYRAAHLGSFVRALAPGADVHLIGTSMGGSILLRDRVAGQPAIPAASVMSISGSGGPWRSAFGAQELGRFDGSREDIARVLDHMADDFVGREAVLEARFDNSRVPGHAECLLAGAAVKHPSLVRKPPADDWPVAQGKVDVPVTVVAGTRDPLLEPGWQDHLDGLSELIRTCAIDAKHAPSLDQPEIVAELVRDHVARATHTKEQQ